MAILANSDWYVTEEKVAEAVRRLIREVNPLAIIAFGSPRTQSAATGQRS